MYLLPSGECVHSTLFAVDDSKFAHTVQNELQRHVASCSCVEAELLLLLAIHGFRRKEALDNEECTHC